MRLIKCIAKCGLCIIRSRYCNHLFQAIILLFKPFYYYALNSIFYMQIIKELNYKNSELFERNCCRKKKTPHMHEEDCTRNCTVSLSAGCLELLQQILGPIDHRFHLAEKRRRLRKSPCNGVPNDLGILDTVQRSRRF